MNDIILYVHCSSSLIQRVLCDARKDGKNFRAAFLSSLVKYRDRCSERLMALILSPNESAAIFAASGLLYTKDFKQQGIKIIESKVNERISQDELNKGEWPIHFLLNFLELLLKLSADFELLMYLLLFASYF